MAVLIVGAAGAVGKRLAAALAARGDRIIAADRMPRLPERIAGLAAATEPGVDVRDLPALRRVFAAHPDVKTVWNLAAPLSVETAMDPSVAEAVTIGGMRNVLEAMGDAGVRRICFTDSIGSFGADAPRRECTARWLTENPAQDPGSDYGLQKRGCRELMRAFAEQRGGDPRWAVLPGVLHSSAVWGKGTTEYALDAMRAAAKGRPYACPIDPDVTLPMVFAHDLLRGLLALQDADEGRLTEPERGYAIPGLSFSANELFSEIRRHRPGFTTTVDLNPNMDKFARLWPDTLSKKEPLTDLGYAPQVGLPEMVDTVMAAHETRNTRIDTAFRDIDDDGNGTIERVELEEFLSQYMFAMPECAGSRPELPRRLRRELCHDLVQMFFGEIDHNQDGRISVEEFHEWARQQTTSWQTLVDGYVQKRAAGGGEKGQWAS